MSTVIKIVVRGGYLKNMIQLTIVHAGFKRGVSSLFI